MARSGQFQADESHSPVVAAGTFRVQGVTSVTLPSQWRCHKSVRAQGIDTTTGKLTGRHGSGRPWNLITTPTRGITICEFKRLPAAARVRFF